MFSEDTARLSSILKLISSEHSDIWFDKCDFLTSCSRARSVELVYALKVFQTVKMNDI